MLTSHPWSHRVRQHNANFGDAFCFGSCAPGTSLGPFPASCTALGSATGLCTLFSCATAQAALQRQPRGRSQGDPLTYRRGSAGSLVQSPGGHLGAASGVRLWRPGELKNNSLAVQQAFGIDDPFRKACGWTQTCPSTQMLFLPLLSWYLCPPHRYLWPAKPSTPPPTG